MAEFAGLRANAGATYATGARDASFFDAVTAQLTPKVSLLLLSEKLMYVEGLGYASLQIKLRIIIIIISSQIWWVSYITRNLLVL